ncbi:oligosaccharide flippase family protein [Flavobacterium wongokense]|uniref:oligosaccharide flippase family protein n=1 Tax=Flavobacterium wongokense TaxID=2910674 RepID=UPI001F35AB5B|nr:oligosaccharide flippase family protein [Flavobacterium sp. WG47]
MEKTTSYKSIFKATSIFGGVQVFNILVTLIRSKAVAILIGTAGMGLNGLFMSSLNLIKTISSLGLSESAVRDISKAHSSGDTNHIGKTFTVFRRWIWITAALGIVITIAFSPLLSKIAFGSTKNWTSYIWLSITFLFGALSGGIYTFLRGTRQIGYLAQANIIGAIAGLVAALPVFYFYGIEGVVPAIILTALGNYLVSLYFRSKVRFDKVNISWAETFSLGKPMVQLGLSLTLINLMTTAIAFVLNAFISKTGNLSDLGLYNAGQAIVEGYVGMVFTAMATDYFPRLSGVIADDKKWKQLVNEQSELVIIILSIVLVLLISTTPILIRILLSKEFLASQDFILWAVLSIPLKGLVWVTGFVILAKGHNKLFLTVEVITNVILLSLNLLFYSLYGLNGLGISIIISYFIFTIIMIAVLKSKYDFNFSTDVITLTLKGLAALSLCLACIKFLGYPNAYYAQAVIVLITISYSLYELNKRVNLKGILLYVKDKIKK